MAIMAFLLNDVELVTSIQTTKNLQLIDELYHRFNKKVYAKCLSMLKNKLDALDVCQDIWLRVSINIFGFKGQASFATWLYKITSNRCIDFLRQKKCRYEIEGVKYHYYCQQINFVGDYTLDNLWQHENNLVQMAQSLEKMALHEREILNLKYFERLSVKEISLKLQLNESAVKMRLQRARKKLSKQLNKVA